MSTSPPSLTNNQHLSPDRTSSMGSSSTHADEGWLLRALKHESVDGDCPESAAQQCSPPNVVQKTAAFCPLAPKTLSDSGLDAYQVEELILKFLLNRGVASGAVVSNQIRLPFGIVDELLRQMKDAQLVAHRGTSGSLGDFEYQLTSHGAEQAKRNSAKCTYYGAAPVPFEQFVASVAKQSVNKERLTPKMLEAALADLSLGEAMLSRLGQAMTAGRALFLYGEPGNGKTSIAERLTRAFGTTIWVPRSINIGDDIVRFYDPVVHNEIQASGLTNADGIDHRWIQIERPTIVVGGELTMDNLEITINPQIGVLEAPVQMKSTCGTLVIDDFGRQLMRPDELLNRWIVPLEKQYDFVNLPSGKKVQVPFDQLTVFSTNLDPKEIVDEAFLRRIPYKMKVSDPSEDEFRQLFKAMAGKQSITYCDSAITHLIERYYQPTGRPFRYCHPRDLLLQIVHLCNYHSLQPEITEHYLDIAADNYFGDM